jgi:hypothetical protein
VFAEMRFRFSGRYVFLTYYYRSSFLCKEEFEKRLKTVLPESCRYYGCIDICSWGTTSYYVLLRFAEVFSCSDIEQYLGVGQDSLNVMLPVKGTDVVVWLGDRHFDVEKIAGGAHALFGEPLMVRLELSEREECVDGGSVVESVLDLLRSDGVVLRSCIQGQVGCVIESALEKYDIKLRRCQEIIKEFGKRLGESNEVMEEYLRECGGILGDDDGGDCTKLSALIF